MVALTFLLLISFVEPSVLFSSSSSPFTSPPFSSFFVIRNVSFMFPLILSWLTLIGMLYCVRLIFYFYSDVFLFLTFAHLRSRDMEHDIFASDIQINGHDKQKQETSAASSPPPSTSSSTTSTSTSSSSAPQGSLLSLRLLLLSSAFIPISFSSSFISPSLPSPFFLSPWYKFATVVYNCVLLFTSITF